MEHSQQVAEYVQQFVKNATELFGPTVEGKCNITALDKSSVDPACLVVAQHVLEKHQSWAAHHDMDRRVKNRVLQAELSVCVAEVLDKSHIPSPPPLFATLPDGLNGILPDANFTRDELNGWTMGNHPAFNTAQQDQLNDLLREYRSAFAYTMQDLQEPYRGEDGNFTVELTSDKPLVAPIRRKSPAEQEVVNQKARELKEAGLIERAPDDNPYVCETTCPLKRDLNGLWTERRFCIDYRPVNAETKPDNYGLNGAEQLFQKIAAARGKNLIFSKLDMKSGFHQIEIEEKDRPKLAFRWGSEIWMFRRMPFGCRNASAKFQRVMDSEIRRAGLEHCCVVYIDDVLVYSATPEEHLQHLAAVFKMLLKVNLRAHPDKSVFAAEVVEYVGHYVSTHGLSPTQARASAIRQLKPPKNLDELRAMLGFMGYYRTFLTNYSAIAQPLTRLLKKDQEWIWEDAQQRAFEQLRDGLSDPNKVLRPMDFTRPIFLYTDWSKQGISGVLAQKDTDGRDYIVACVSRSLNMHEQNYSSPEGELLAVVWATKTLRLYLHGVKFTLITDHTPLLHLMKDKEVTGKRARWALLLQEYYFDVVHRAGVKHTNADYPSRYPCPDDTDLTGARLDEDSHSPPPLPKVYDSEGQLQANCVTCRPLYVRRELPTCAPAPSECLVDLDELIGYNADHLVMASDVIQDAEESSGSPHTVLVEAAMSKLPRKLAVAQLPLRVEAVDGQLQVQSVNTAVLGSCFFDQARHGLVVLELFGGICTGLEMVLRTGGHVVQYHYCDIDPVVRKVAAHRLNLLHRRFPAQLPLSAIAEAFTLHQDVRMLSLPDIKDLTARHQGAQWLLVGGWECQDLSPAGQSRGIHGRRSNTFFDLVRVLACLQMCVPTPAPGYLLENVSLADNFNSVQVREYSQRVVTDVIGRPVVLDAAQFGSRAHRLRSFWSNLFCAGELSWAARFVQRPVGLTVDDILDDGRFAQADINPPSPPFYQCHRHDPIDSRTMLALPTFVSFIASRAYRDGARGVIFDSRTGLFVEPNPDERERAMGFHTGDTAAPDITWQQRHEITGRCMDINTLTALWHLASDVARWHHRRHELLMAPAAVVSFEEDLHHSSCSHVLTCMRAPEPKLIQEKFIMTLTELEDRHDAELAPGVLSRDIWLDSKTLSYLRESVMPADSTREERKRITKRAAGHQWTKDKLYRVCADGKTRIVPPPEEREEIIWQTHRNCGHFGVLRTISLLRTAYYWSGLDDQVKQLLAKCTVCDRVRASFTRPSPELQPLPIEPMFYRVGVDLFGPIKSKCPHEYGMVMIEHFSKHLEVAPLESKTALNTARAFLTHFISRFGACAEVLTDGGSEFKGAFDALLVQCRIDHRVTSPSHPQTDGLAERAVQTVKRAITKYAELHPQEDWTARLPWILLGYRASKQSSTRYSPYYLLHARHPVIPPAIRERMEPVLNLDTVEGREEAAIQLIERAALLERHVPMAMNNLRIAQHQDTLRYAKVRSGDYHPKLQRFEVGQFVYVKRSNARSLEPKVHVIVLRVVEVRRSGVLRLQGKCGRIVSVHSSNCAPCHLSGIDPLLDPLLFRPPASLECQICKSNQRDHEMLLCDHCNTGWHMSCMGMPPKVPKGLWTCPNCTADGHTADWLMDYRRDLGILREVDDPKVATIMWSVILPS